MNNDNENLVTPTNIEFAPSASAELKNVLTVTSDGVGVRIHYGAGATGDELTTALLMLTNFIFVNNATRIFNTESLVADAFNVLCLQYLEMFANQIVPEDSDAPLMFADNEKTLDYVDEDAIKCPIQDTCEHTEDYDCTECTDFDPRDEDVIEESIVEEDSVTTAPIEE